MTAGERLSCPDSLSPICSGVFCFFFPRVLSNRREILPGSVDTVFFGMFNKISPCFPIELKDNFLAV